MKPAPDAVYINVMLSNIWPKQPNLA